MHARTDVVPFIARKDSQGLERTCKATHSTLVTLNLDTSGTLQMITECADVHVVNITSNAGTGRRFLIEDLMNG